MPRAERAEEAKKKADWMSWIKVNSLDEDSDSDAGRSDGGGDGMSNRVIRVTRSHSLPIPRNTGVVQ